MSITRRAAAELFGTFWLVLGGVGSAVIAGDRIGALGIALAFGLTVLTMVYAIGHISGAHLNPAVTTGLTAAGRFPLRDLPVYVIAQLLGAILGAWVVLLIARAAPAGYDPATQHLAANGFGAHSPAGYSVAGALLVEVVTTFFFVLVVLGATSARGLSTFGGIAIGLCLTLVHLVSIPVTNASVNPARSTGPALFVGGWAMAQLWLFWLAPLLGALLAGLMARLLEPDQIVRRGAMREERASGAPLHPRPTARS